MNRAQALQVLHEICNIFGDGLIENMFLNKNAVTEEYTLMLKVHPSGLDRNVLEPILDKYNLAWKARGEFVFIHSAKDGF